MIASRTALLALLLLSTACGGGAKPPVVEPPHDAAPEPEAGGEEGATEAADGGSAEGEADDGGSAQSTPEGVAGAESAPEEEPEASSDGIAAPKDPPATPAPAIDDDPRKPACPGIDGALSALIRAEDRAAAAKAQGLTMVEDRVRVVAELAAADSDLEGPVEEEQRSGTNAQVLIQPDSICEFAASAGVRRVRKPMPPSAK
jgi:hypothetical protein